MRTWLAGYHLGCLSLISWLPEEVATGFRELFVVNVHCVDTLIIEREVNGNVERLRERRRIAPDSSTILAIAYRRRPVFCVTPARGSRWQCPSRATQCDVTPYTGRVIGVPVCSLLDDAIPCRNPARTPSPAIRTGPLDQLRGLGQFSCAPASVHAMRDPRSTPDPRNRAAWRAALST